MDNLNIPVLFPNDERWQQCLVDFLNDLHNRSGSKASVASYVGILARFFVGKDPESVTRADVSQFIYAPNNKPWAKSVIPAAATINKRCAAIRSLYSYASGYTINGDHGPEPLYQHANPCSGIKFGKPARAYKALSPTEIQSFFAAIDRQQLIGKRDFALFTFMLMSARRRSSVARLTFGDLEQALISDENGGSHLGWIYRFTEKGTSTQQDSQEISSSVVALIMEYLKEALPAWPPAPNTPLWLAIGPGEGCGGNVRPGEIRALSGRAMESAMKKHAAAAGIDPHKLSLHSWRHSSAKMRRLAGSSIMDISRTLRHASLDMTMRYVGALVSQSDTGGKLLEAQFTQLGIL